MRKVLLAVGLAAGMGVSYAAALLVYPPTGSDDAFVGTAVGSGSAFVQWTLDQTAGPPEVNDTFVAMFDFGGGLKGYIVADATDLVVEDGFVDAAPVHFATAAGLAYNATIGDGPWYYLATCDSDLAIGDPICAALYESERFELNIIPETSTYALLAGLGLLGFAGYRRFRG